MYDYLARSQARNWPYSASRRGRVLGVQQDTLGLALALRSYLVRNLLRPQGYREELVKALPKELVKAPLRTYLVSGIPR